MASGLPDFTRPIDVAAQSLQEVTIRNRFGAPELSEFNNEATAPIPVTTSYDLIEVEGQGVLYGGVIRLTWNVGNPDASQSYFYLEVDGELITSQPIQRMKDWNAQPLGAIVGLLRYDQANGIVDLAIPKDVTFEESLILGVTTVGADTLYVQSKIVTATV